MLGQQRTTGGGEKMPKKLDLGNSKFTLWETNHQPMLTTKEKNLPEMVNMGGEISAEDFDPSDV